jgi:hypothetical protein
MPCLAYQGNNDTIGQLVFGVGQINVKSNKQECSPYAPVILSQRSALAS